jgi:hypothetical protein
LVGVIDDDDEVDDVELGVDTMYDDQLVEDEFSI